MTLGQNPTPASESRPGGAAVAAGILAALLALPAGADWLVTRDGAQIETREPWEVKGKLVVFTLASGNLSSMRLSELDLDASQRLTDQRARPRAAASKVEKAPKKAVVVLRDEDVAHVGPGGRVEPAAEREGEGEAEGSARSGAESAGAGKGVDVAGWSHVFNDTVNGVELEGTLRNFGQDMAVDVSMEVVLYGERGRLVGTGSATVENRVIKPGEISTFRAVFPGILGFEKPEFRIRSTPLVTTPVTESDDDELD